MALALLSWISSWVLGGVLLALGIRRQRYIASLAAEDPMAAYLAATRAADDRNGWRILGIEALYLLFVLGLAAAGLSRTPAAAPWVTLVIALVFSGSLALLCLRFWANQCRPVRLLWPPLLLMAFGIAYPAFSDPPGAAQAAVAAP